MFLPSCWIYTVKSKISFHFQCRVFDQNERYNVFLEETLWTRECADILIKNHKGNDSLTDFVLTIINTPKYKGTLYKLCNNNIVIFKDFLEGNGNELMRSDVINPKIKLFVDKLSGK